MTTKSSETRHRLLDAAQAVLQERGYSGLSTRRVAERADMPLSQIHYHFGSRQQLTLALLQRQNDLLLERQKDLYDANFPLWKQWNQACDYLEDDIESGYVTILQEMIAAGWSDPEIGAAVRSYQQGWYDLLTDVAERAESAFGPFVPFTPGEVAALTATMFMGAEQLILLGVDEDTLPIRGALRSMAALIRQMEEGP